MSHRIVTTHGLGVVEAPRHLERAENTFRPAEPPMKIPSSRVSRRAVRKASASDTVIHSSTTPKSSEVGILSPPMPSTL